MNESPEEGEGSLEKQEKRTINKPRIAMYLSFFIVGIVAIGLIWVLAYQPPEEPYNGAWWTSESYCEWVEVSDVTKDKSLGGWNMTVHLNFEKMGFNTTMRYIMIWSDGNLSVKSLNMITPDVTYEHQVEYDILMYFRTESNPNNAQIVIDECG